MGGACSIHGRIMRRVYKIVAGKPNIRRNHLDHQDGNRMTLKVRFVYCFSLTQDGRHWRALVNTVLNLPIY
jgi:hypothetical protein